MKFRSLVPIVVPFLALAAVFLTLSGDIPVVVAILVGVVIVAAVLAAVHHAEIIAHRVGEPLGSVILAVSVTVIEVGLIITLMIGGHGHETETLARDTAFAAVMITCNGIIGLSVFLASLRHGIPRFNPEGAAAELGVIAALAGLTLVVPTFTTGASGGRFTGVQLGFVAVIALVVYVGFIATQTVRHRDFFLPVTQAGTPLQPDEHAKPPSNRATVVSLVLLAISLFSVVMLGHADSPSIERGLAALGIPTTFVGVVIAFIVLLPEGIAASRAALKNRLQTSLNLGYGSSIASIGLTIPAIAVASIWIEGPLVLGLDPLQITLLILTLIVSTLTILPGRSTRLQGVLHLILLASFVFLAINP